MEHPINRLKYMRKTHTLDTLTVGAVARNEASAWMLEATIFHGTSPRGHLVEDP